MGSTLSGLISLVILALDIWAIVNIMKMLHIVIIVVVQRRGEARNIKKLWLGAHDLTDQ